MSSTVSTKEVDFLDEDKPIRGQNYVCLSFLSPEDVLANKDVFFFEKYMANYLSQMHEVFNNLKAKYPDDHGIFDAVKESNPQFFSSDSFQDDFRVFKSAHSAQLESEFLEKNDFRTSVRGIKVRGSFDTLKEAQNRAELLKRMGDKFDIYVAQVGCWCPWSPNPTDLENCEYMETQLNTLMKKYQDNQSLRDEFFEQRKREKMEDARKKAQEAKQKAKTEVVVEDTDASTSADAGLTGDDIWLSRKTETDSTDKEESK